MRFPRILSSAAVFTLVSVVAADGASDVISLTSSNFDAIVNPEPLILVEFFAPWYAALHASLQVHFPHTVL